MLSTKDVIKDSVLNSITGGSNITFATIWLSLFTALILGVFIFCIYKSFSKSAFYSKDLNITLAGMPIVIAALMLAMQSDLIVSLGMVGALSIVRFRTAVKNPMDLLYLFWSISGGIICGVGLYLLVVILCIMMTLLIFLLNKAPSQKAPSLLVLRTNSEIDMSMVDQVLTSKCSYVQENSMVMKNGEKEIIYEVKSKDAGTVVSYLGNLKGVVSVNWLSHSGELRK